MLAFEYQGEHHYENLSYFTTPTSKVQEFDNLKLSKCIELGITLVQVPFWWDLRKNSLVKLTRSQRPDLLRGVAESSKDTIKPRSSSKGTLTAEQGLHIC